MTACGFESGMVNGVLTGRPHTPDFPAADLCTSAEDAKKFDFDFDKVCRDSFIPLEYHLKATQGMRIVHELVRL